MGFRRQPARAGIILLIICAIVASELLLARGLRNGTVEAQAGYPGPSMPGSGYPPPASPEQTRPPTVTSVPASPTASATSTAAVTLTPTSFATPTIRATSRRTATPTPPVTIRPSTYTPTSAAIVLPPTATASEAAARVTPAELMATPAMTPGVVLSATSTIPVAGSAITRRSAEVDLSSEELLPPVLDQREAPEARVSLAVGMGLAILAWWIWKRWFVAN